MSKASNPLFAENNTMQTNTPQPVMECAGCGGTIWRLGDWLQCPDCGGRSSLFGGFFPAIAPDGNQDTASENFINAVNMAKHKKAGFPLPSTPNKAGHIMRQQHQY